MGIEFNLIIIKQNIREVGFFLKDFYFLVQSLKNRDILRIKYIYFNFFTFF